MKPRKREHKIILLATLTKRELTARRKSAEATADDRAIWWKAGHWPEGYTERDARIKDAIARTASDRVRMIDRALDRKVQLKALGVITKDPARAPEIYPPGSMWKFRSGGGYFRYCEVTEPKYIKPPADMPGPVVYVSTRTPHRTSIYGQIESAGFISIALLVPFTDMKDDLNTLADLERVQREGAERSQFWYGVYKNAERMAAA